MPEPMSDEAVRAALGAGSAWTLEDGALRRRLRFGSFSEALGFLVRVGLAAERMDHHPELRNVYDRVEVALTSHDAGGVTERDLELARRIDALAGDAAGQSSTGA